MMRNDVDFYKEAREIWNNVAGGSKAEELNFNLEVREKMLNLFQVGNFYYFIFNIKTAELEYISPGVTKLLGFDPEETSVAFLMSRIHPEDQPYFLNFEDRVRTFFAQLPIDKIYKYKVRYDYRLKNSKDEYIRILHQATTIKHHEGNLIYSFGVHTDINHLKRSGVPTLSFIGMDGEPSFVDVGIEKKFHVSKSMLSKREKEVMKLLVSGYTSKQIALHLNIARQTVETHRKNMLRKMNSASTYELISKCINNGWI